MFIKLNGLLMILNDVLIYFHNIHNVMESIVSICLICASFLISKQNQNAFWFWLVGNIIGIFFFYIDKNYWMTILSIYSTITSIYGLWNWKIKNKQIKNND